MDIGSGIAAGCACFSVAYTVVKLFGKNEKSESHPQCAVHAVVMENLKEAMDEIKDRLGKIEGTISKVLTGMTQ